MRQLKRELLEFGFTHGCDAVDDVLNLRFARGRLLADGLNLQHVGAYIHSLKLELIKSMINDIRI